MEKFEEAFKRADLNGDNLLDRAEFGTFMVLLKHNADQEGLPHKMMTRDQIDIAFPIYDKFRKITKGVSIFDIFYVNAMVSDQAAKRREGKSEGDVGQAQK